MAIGPNFTKTELKNIMRLINSIFYILLLTFITGCVCDRVDDRELVVLNNSKDTIFSIISTNDTIGGDGSYAEFDEDENEYKNYPREHKFIFELIKPNEAIANHDTPRWWDVYFNEIEDKKLRLFIVPQDSVKKYGWYKIFNNNIYIKKYTLSLEDIEKQNWVIEYK